MFWFGSSISPKLKPLVQSLSRSLFWKRITTHPGSALSFLNNLLRSKIYAISQHPPDWILAGQITSHLTCPVRWLKATFTYYSFTGRMYSKLFCLFRLHVNEEWEKREKGARRLEERGRKARGHWSTKDQWKKKRETEKTEGVSQPPSWREIKESNGVSSGHKRATVHLLTNQIWSVPNMEMF